jgi:probable F420-dependent oxidoreductase
VTERVFKRPIGIMFNTDRMSGIDLVDFAKRLEDQTINTIWVTELFGREPFATAGFLLARTESIRVATGIANVYARDAVAAAAAGQTLTEFSSGRFVLGLGVSNSGLASQRGHVWEPPVRKLEMYIDSVRHSQITIPGDLVTPLHVAAHGPKMLDMVIPKVDGVSTFLQTPTHTQKVKAQLNGSTELNVSQMCLLCEDRHEARRLARKALAFYMTLDYYHRAWRKLGFSNPDFENGGSDALIDSLVAWGSPLDILTRIDEHHSAGATEVVVIPLNPEGGSHPHWSLINAITE